MRSRGVCSLREGGHVYLRWLTVLTGVFFLVMSFLRISNLFRSDLSLMSLSLAIWTFFPSIIIASLHHRWET